MERSSTETPIHRGSEPPLLRGPGKQVPLRERPVSLVGRNRLLPVIVRSYRQGVLLLRRGLY